MGLTVIVDDADPQIVYSGLWSSADPLALGPAYSGIDRSIGSTLHNATVIDRDFVEPSRSFSFKFNGTSVSVYAVVTPELVQRATDPYNWLCTVDGTGTTPIALQQASAAITLQICTAGSLNETTEHTLNFVLETLLTGSNEATTMLFDYLEYTPLDSSVDRTFDYISVSYDSPEITYNGPWSQAGMNSGAIGSEAVSTNSSVEYRFNGTSVSWIGIIDARTGVTNARFSIDGQPPITEALPTINSSLIVPNKVTFQSPSLNRSTVHSIKAELLEYPNPKTPGPGLILQSLIIANGTIPASTSLSPLTATSPSPFPTVDSLTTSSTRPQDAMRHRKGLIAGVISGILVLVCTILVALYFWRRNRRARHQQRSKRLAEPFSQIPEAQKIAVYHNLLLPAAKSLAVFQRLNRPDIIPSRKEILYRSGRENSQEHGTRAHLESGSRNVDDVEAVSREQDSGLRRIEEIGVEESMTRVLPPVYTAE